MANFQPERLERILALTPGVKERNMRRHAEARLMVLAALLTISLLCGTPFNGSAGGPEPPSGSEVAVGSIDGTIVFSPLPLDTGGSGFFVGSCNGIAFAASSIPFGFTYSTLTGGDLADFRLGSGSQNIVPAQCVPNGAVDIIITQVNSFTEDLGPLTGGPFKIAQVKMKFLK